MRRFLAVGLLVFVVGCGRAVMDSPPPSSSDAGSEPVPPDADAFHPALIEAASLCKLLSNRSSSDPTPNDVQHRANILGADLGIPVVANDKLYLMFGDTIGFAGERVAPRWLRPERPRSPRSPTVVPGSASSRCLHRS